MSLITLLIVLAAFGLILWLINTYVPMDATVKRVIMVVGIIAIIVYALYAFGVLDDIKDVKVPR